MAEKEKKTDETKEKGQEIQESENIVTIEEAGPCKKKVVVEIPAEAIEKMLSEQYEDLRTDTVVPGFRKGRAPLRLLEKRFGSDVRDKVKLKLLADASDAALKDNDLDVLGDPDIDYEKIELPETGPMKFDFEVEVRPQFELPPLEGIKVEKPKIEITDKELDDEVQAVQKRLGMWTPKEGTVEDDDQIIADVLLKIEGVAEEEKHDNVDIFVRPQGLVSGVPIEKLAELLVGAGEGAVKKITVEVPATFHNERYRGKKVDIEIEVKEVKQLVPAELNEELFKRLGIEGETQLREMISDSKKSQAERDAQAAVSEQIFKYLLDNIDLELPVAVVADQSKHILQRQYTNLLMQGLERGQVDEQMESLQTGSEIQAREQLKRFFIMGKVAEKFDIKVSEEEINGHIALVAASRGRRPEKVREELAQDGSLVQFSLQIREQKCVEKLLESAKITEVKAGAPGAGKAKDKAMKKAAKKIEKKAEKKTAKKTEKKAGKKTAKKKDSPDEKAQSRQDTAAKRKKKDGTA